MLRCTATLALVSLLLLSGIGVATAETATAVGGTAANTTGVASTAACATGGSGTLTIDVYGHDGNEIEDGEVYLFDQSYNLQYDTDFYGGQVTFQGVDLGEYNVEVYSDDGEFLGVSSVCHDGYTSTDYYAGSPNLDSVTYEEESGDGDGVIEPGEEVLVSPRVVNDDGYTLDVRTDITYESESETRGPLSISGSGDKASYGAQFDVDSGGEKDVTIEVYAKYGGGWTLTHEVDRTLEIDEPPTSSREDPDDEDVDAVVGESVTFEVQGEDDDELGGVEWYVNGEYETRDGLQGDDDTDEFTVTFEDAGEHTVEADVYDDEGSTYNDDAAEWTVDVDEPVTYTLSTSSSDGGTVSVSPDENEYEDGGVVTLTAEASDNFEFDHWEGDVPDYKQDDSEIELEMDDDRSVQAVFTRDDGAVKLDVQHPNGDRATEVNAILVRNDGELVREATWAGDNLIDVPRTFDGLAAGEQYSFEVYINDQFAVTKSVAVAADETTSVTAEASSPVWLRPKVVDAAGNPLEGVSVAVYSHEYDQDDGDPTEPWRGNPTDERGYVKTPAGDGKLYLHPTDDSGYYVIVVSRDGEQLARKTVDGLTSDREVTVETSVTSVDSTVAGWTIEEATSDDGEVAVGERTAVGVTLRNDGTEMPLRTVFQFDTDGDGEPEAVDVDGDGEPDYADYDADGDAEPGTVRGDVEATNVASGDTQPFGLKFAPGQAGDWRVRAVMQAHPNDEWVDAGTTDWEGFSVVGTEESAEIVDSETEMPSGTFEPGEDVTATVTVQNTGTVEETFYLNHTAEPTNGGKRLQGGVVPVKLEPGETRQVEVSLQLPNDISPGRYHAYVTPWTTNDDSGALFRRATDLFIVDTPGAAVEYYDLPDQEKGKTDLEPVGRTFSFDDASVPSQTDYTTQESVPSKRRVRNTQTYPWSAVGQVGDYCSGVLIEDNHVVTAAHCVMDDSGYYYSESNVNFTPGMNAGESPHGTVDVIRVQRLESYNPTNPNGQYDLAVLTLAENVGKKTGTFGFASFDSKNPVYKSDLRTTGYPTSAGYVDAQRSQWTYLVNGKGVTGWLACGNQKCIKYGVGEILPNRNGTSGGPVWKLTDGEPTVLGVNHKQRPGEVIAFRIDEQRYNYIGQMVTEGNEVPMPPSAAISVESGESAVGETVTLSADGATHPDGTVESYLWDVDGDGQFEKDSGGTPTIEWTPQSRGEREITVKTVDSDGDSDTASLEVQVRQKQASAPQFQNRAVYVWGYADDLARNAAARERFLDRADEQNLNTVFLSWGALSTASPERRATLLRALNESGIQPHAMVGAAGPNAIQTTRDTIPEVLAYNANRPEAEQFDGLHLDAEPGEAELRPFLDDYQTLLSEVETGISGDGETVRSQELAVSSAVGWWWDQSDQAPEATDELVESSALDYVVVMAFHDEVSEVRDRTAAITDETDTPYVVAVETQEFARNGTTERVSFYEEGPEATTDALSAIADDPPREGHRGGALHYYQSAVAAWDSLRGGSTPDEGVRGKTMSVETNVVFDDSFPQSSHRSQLVVEFRGPDETYTVRKTVTPPGGEVTDVRVDWSPPTDAATGEYTVVATLRDTTFENGDRQPVGSREPVTLDTERLGTVTVTKGDTEEPANEPPTLSVQQPANLVVGESTTLAATAEDPDGYRDFLSFDWRVVDTETGYTEVSATTDEVSQLDWSPEEPHRYRIEVTVTDRGGATATTNVTVDVDENNDDPTPPPQTTPETEADTVAPGGRVTLDANATDGDSDSDLQYEWTQVAGPQAAGVTDANTATPTLTTPQVSQRRTLRYRVTVTDGDTGATATGTVAVTVAPDDTETRPRTFGFETESALESWQTGKRGDSRASEGDVSWSDRAGGSLRLTADGGPGTAMAWREVGPLAAGTEIRVEYGPERFEYNAAGLHLYVIDGDGDRTRLDIDNSGAGEQNGTLVGTVPRDLGPDAELELKLVIWPGETTVYVDSVTVGADTVGDRDDTPYTATRSVDGPVAPGETATVTVTVDVNDSVDALALDADPGDASLRRNSSTPTAQYRAAERQWLWLSGTSGTYTVTYDVQVPEDATPTRIDLSGTVSAEGQPSVTVGGDDAVRVRQCAGAVAAGDDRRLSLREVQRLIGNWADDEPVAGETLRLEQIQRLIGLWADDDRVTCGGDGR